MIELRYNLARAHDDAGEPSASRPIYESLLADDPDDHRFAERLVQALLETGDRRAARSVLDAFDARCAETASAAEAEVARRRETLPDDDLQPALRPADSRELHERRTLTERSGGHVGLRTFLRLRVDLADERFDDVRADLAAIESLYAGDQTARPPAVFLASVHARLRDDDSALAWVGRALETDPDSWEAHALAARLHLRNRRFARASEAAASSLALIYFQPVMHYVLGRSLVARGDEAEAEREFLVAVSQAPGLVPAHEWLARLYEKQPGRQADATRHRNRAAELRRKHRERRNEGARPANTSAPLADSAAPPRPANPLPERASAGASPADAGLEVVVVAGLPRSGTSMLMQMLAAGGIPPLTDGLREADDDNPRGYFEYEPATRLNQGDHAWLTEARGKAVKLALPLVASLPPAQPYLLIVIERDVAEVIASQRAMLRRLGRLDAGARLDDTALAAEYARHRERLRVWLNHRPEIAVLPLQYASVLADPGATARRIASFLDRHFDVDAASQAVAPSLRRQNTGASPAS